MAAALPWYERAAKDEPGNAMPHYYLGYAYKERGQHARAVQQFKAFLEKKPDAPERQDIEAEIELALGDLLQPTQRRISLGVPGPDGAVQTRTVTVNIPAGLRPGSRVRLAGQGGPGAHGGPAGDIFLKIRLRPEPNVQLEGDDVVTEAELPAPIAVTGGTLRVATPDGPVTLRIPPGTQSGTVLRVKGRGLPKSGATRGDLRVRVRVTVPEHPTERELQLYRELGELLKD
jgi:hypothetical protein